MSINMRSRKSPAADRISSLPCDILEKILGCLPLRDAIRTSVLSKQWSYKWIQNVHEFSLRFLKSKDFRLPSHLFKFQDLSLLPLRILWTVLYMYIPWGRSLKRLKSVDLDLMQCNEVEMEFLKYVLSSATALEKICVVTSAEFSHRGIKMMEEMK
ncbi:hypothetical protein RND71_016188 [Anisodus tanguticus]|uniref:F-box domain-containing protein n=1 Tax=Anisodus tanguticus TaxID=243964 RepID=A0AAE1S7B8_9SOLA|nr:hypothetical protein RND71_016188 [Anisodus tanguticus]